MGETESNARLLASERRFRDLVETSHDLIWSVDAEGRITYLNHACRKIYGREPQEMIGRFFLEFVPPDQYEKDLAVFTKALQTGEKTVEYTSRIYRKDGSIAVLSANAVIIYDQDGRVAGSSGISRDITENLIAQEALKKSELEQRQLAEQLKQERARLVAAQAVAKIGSWETDLSTLAVVWSEETYRIFETTAEKFQPTHAGFLAFVHPEDRAAVDKAFEDSLSQTGPFVYEHRLMMPDGRVKFVEEHWQVFKDDAGRPLRAGGTCQDITERKGAEKLLQLSERRHRLLFQANPLPMFVYDLETLKYLAVNPMAVQTYGYTEAEFLTMTIRDIRPAEDVAKLELTLKTLPSGTKDLGVWRHRKKSGEIFFVEISSDSIDFEGRLARLVLVNDITERKRAEEELRWKTAFLEAQVDSSMDGILVVDSQGKDILRNQRLNDLWKIPPEIATSKDDRVQVEFVATRTKDPEQFAAKVAYLYSHPEEVSRDEIELVDGTILDRYSSPVRDKAGTYYGRIWTFRDITEQRELEKQFRQSQKMEAFGQLAGGVAHDFNNILAVIQLQAALLEESEQKLTPEQLNIASDIGAAAERGANLTRQLLLFSRRQTLQPQNLKLKDVVGNISRMLMRTLGEHIQLQFKFSEESLYIRADAGMIDQIILNLTVNARDAMPKGGHILIETAAAEFDEVTATQVPEARPGSFVCLSVTDTGTGIPPEILPQIFEPFFTTKDLGKGTGLGLATVYGIVKQHGGWINVYSQVNRGTAFRVYLPRLAGTFDTTFRLLSKATSVSGNETILLAEDEATVRSCVRKTLSRLGYRVLEASDGKNAIEVWKQHRNEIRLLLTDMVMPGGMTGKELARALMEQDPKLKVVYTSGYSAEFANESFPLDEGVNFLAKPFDSQKLADTIRRALDQSLTTDGHG